MEPRRSGRSRKVGSSISAAGKDERQRMRQARIDKLDNDCLSVQVDDGGDDDYQVCSRAADPGDAPPPAAALLPHVATSNSRANGRRARLAPNAGLLRRGRHAREGKAEEEEEAQGQGSRPRGRRREKQEAQLSREGIGARVALANRPPVPARWLPRGRGRERQATRIASASLDPPARLPAHLSRVTRGVAQRSSSDLRQNFRQLIEALEYDKYPAHVPSYLSV